jgi:hypothetical protein
MKLDPFANAGKVFEAWQQLADDSIARTAAFFSEFDKLEAKAAERAEGAIEEAAKLTKETLAYNAQLAAEWRKLSLETVKRATAAFHPATAD